MYNNTTIYNKPYTYLIGWSNENKWYYGVRYAKNCNPDELWKTYFTSSKYVKNARKLYGEPDIIEVRKIFDSSEKAQIWEHKVLKRMKVIYEEKWLNKTDNKSIDYFGIKRNTLPGRIASLEKRKGKTFEEIHGIEEANRLKEIFRKNGKKVWETPELVERMKKKPEDTTNYKLAAKKRWSNTEDREKRQNAMKGKRKIIICPHCGKNGGGGGMRRYHLDNCAKKSI